MTIPRMVADALEERGSAVLVVGRPSDGEDAPILSANSAFAAVVGSRAQDLVGSPVGVLRSIVADLAQWTVLVDALRQGRQLKLDLRLLAGDHEVWFSFDLIFKHAENGALHGIVIGRDTTQTIRRAAEDSATQRLLAAMFLRIGVPIVIVAANGEIRMSNPAFQQLLEYDAREIVGLNVAVLTPPDYEPTIRAMRVQQLRDGKSYEVRMVTVTKTGRRIPATLRSVLLNDADQRLRLVTLTPERLPEAAPALEAVDSPMPSPMPRRSVGQVQAVSLAAFRVAFKGGWETIALRAMLIAESIIKRRLGQGDVVTRSDDGFLVWFASDDEERNAAILGGAAREIRLRFMTEFTEQVASQVSSVVVSEDWASGDPREPSPALLERFEGARERGAREARALVAELRDQPAADIRRVVDRDGKPKAMVTIDFAPELRARMQRLAPFLPGKPGVDTDPDLLRLDLAIGELGRRRDSVMVAIAWPVLAGINRRRALELRLAELGGERRANLILAVTGVPALPSGKRWAEVTGPLRRRALGEIGLTLTVADSGGGGEEAVAASWPVSLLVLDGTQPGSAAPDGYFGVIAAARRRNIPVLAQFAASGDMRDWRELGATMFVGPDAAERGVDPGGGMRAASPRAVERPFRAAVTLG